MASPPAIYEIDPNGDLLVNIIEYNYDSPRGSDGKRAVLKEALMRVNRQTLMDHSDPFRAMLSGGFAEARQNTVTIEEESIVAAELWFRVLHKSVNEEPYSIEIGEVWNAIQFSRDWLVHLEKLEAFDNKLGFAYVTKRVAHEGVGHFEELNSTRHRHLHLEGRVIQQINEVRGSMRVRILKGVFNPLDSWCPFSCKANEKALKSYVNAIQNTAIWPLDSLHRRSNETIVDSPGFKQWKAEKPEGACLSCVGILNGGHIRKTRGDVLNYWEGLCLDCMEISNPKTGDLDDDYWRHNKLQEWDADCEVNHGRNTWCFSFMGRKEKMDIFNKEQQARKRAAR